MTLRFLLILVLLGLGACPALAECERPVLSCASVAALLGQRGGYGREATGGLDGEFVTVTSNADSGPGTLREAVEGARGRRWVRFASDMTITLGSLIHVPSHVTVDGRERSVTLLNHGFAIYGAEHVILTHLTIDGRFEGISQAVNIADFARHVWLNHLDLARFNDRLVNVKTGSTDVTLSWIKFHDHNKVMLLNNLTTENVFENYDRDSKVRVTLDHCWFVNTIQRNPRAQFGMFHIYNNLLEDWDFYGMSFSLEARATVEGNIFANRPDRRCVEPDVFKTTHHIDRNYCGAIPTAASRAILPNGSSDEKAYQASKDKFHYSRDFRAFLKIRDNIDLAGVGIGVEAYKPERVPPLPYCYAYEKPNADLARRIREGAGNKPDKRRSGASICPTPEVLAAAERAAEQGPSGWKLLGRGLAVVEGSMEADAFTVREIEGEQARRGITRTLNGSASQRWIVELQFRATGNRQLGVWMFDPRNPNVRVMALCPSKQAVAVGRAVETEALRVSSEPTTGGYRSCRVEATPASEPSSQLRVDLIMSEGKSFASAGQAAEAITLKNVRIVPAQHP